MEIAVKAKDGSITRLDITDEQANYLGLSAEGKPLYDTGFSRVAYNQPYFYIDLVVKKSVDNHTIDADTLYSYANYFNNKQFANKVLKAVMIYLKLLQWQALNDKPISTYNPNEQPKIRWVISKETGYDRCTYVARAQSFEYDMISQVYFSSAEKCNEAIQEFKEDIDWYFNKFQGKTHISYTERIEQDEI
jgi:hypothetical protein